MARCWGVAAQTLKEYAASVDKPVSKNKKQIYFKMPKDTIYLLYIFNSLGI